MDRLAMTRARGGCLAALLGLALAGCAAERLPFDPTRDAPPLLLAFLSERPPSTPFTTDIYLCDLRSGAPAQLAPNLNTPSNDGPCALSADGRLLAYFGAQLPTGSTAQILLYTVASGQKSIPAKINQLFGLQNPTLSGDARFLAAQYQVSGPFDLYIAVQDLAGDSLLPVPTLNEPNATNFDPSLDGSGARMAFASNRLASQGAFDIFLYSVPGDSLIPLPGLNSGHQELSPSISGDGRYLAFQSGRPGGVGLIDVYVYDRQSATLLDLPGANTSMSEIHPTLSPDGRYLAFTTEAEGGQNIRLYDLRERRLVLLANCNDPYFFDSAPALAGL